MTELGGQDIELLIAAKKLYVTSYPRNTVSVERLAIDFIALEADSFMGAKVHYSI